MSPVHSPQGPPGAAGRWRHAVAFERLVRLGVPGLRLQPVNQACPGDNTQGWAFSPYLTADDPAQLVFGTLGNPTSPLGGRTASLHDTGGNLVLGLFPEPPPSTGALTTIPNISFAQSFPSTTAANSLAPGVYNVGVACFNASAQAGRRPWSLVRTPGTGTRG